MMNSDTLLTDTEEAADRNLDVYEVTVTEGEIPNVPTDSGRYRVAGEMRHHLTDQQKCDVIGYVREREGSPESVFGSQVVAKVAFNVTTGGVVAYDDDVGGSL